MAPCPAPASTITWPATGGACCTGRAISPPAWPRYSRGSRLVDRVGADRCLAGFRLTRSVRLLDLTGDWPTRAGASQALASGPRPRAQAWARAIYEAYPGIDGMWYPSSMPGGHPTVVLFERAEQSLPPSPDLDVPLSHPGLLADLVRAVGALGYLLR